MQMRKYLCDQWRYFVRRLARKELEKQKQYDLNQRKLLTDRHHEKEKELEELVGNIVSKLVRLETEYRLRPGARIMVHAEMPVSQMGWMPSSPYGMDEREKEYIAKYIGKMVEKEVYYMKPVPTDR